MYSIYHAFICMFKYPPTSSGSNTKLTYFIAHRTNLRSLVMFTALSLQQRWYVMTATLSSPGWLLARVYSSFTRSTRWSIRCASILIWSWMLNQVSSKHLKIWLVKTFLAKGHTSYVFFKTFQILLWHPPTICTICLSLILYSAALGISVTIFLAFVAMNGFLNGFDNNCPSISNENSFNHEVVGGVWRQAGNFDVGHFLAVVQR